MKKSTYNPNGDFSKEEVAALVEEYCERIKEGSTGLAVSFYVWVELRGIAKFHGMRSGGLKRLEDSSCECEMCEANNILKKELLH